jgi:hypothetical protein
MVLNIVIRLSTFVPGYINYIMCTLYNVYLFHCAFNRIFIFRKLDFSQTMFSRVLLVTKISLLIHTDHGRQVQIDTTLSIDIYRIYPKSILNFSGQRSPSGSSCCRQKTPLVHPYIYLSFVRADFARFHGHHCTVYNLQNLAL